MLESLVATSTRVPATRRTLVDPGKIRELVDQMRLAIPQDLKAAQEVLQGKDLLISQAQAEARKIREAAEEEYRARVEESEVVKGATQRAEELSQEAQQKAQRQLDQAELHAKSRIAEADTYAAQVLKRLEQQLATTLDTVRRGMDVLDTQEAAER
ncbi:MAG: hypothetical protein ACE5IG_00410 [Dehalococcoidia bacterium]